MWNLLRCFSFSVNSYSPSISCILHYTPIATGNDDDFDWLNDGDGGGGTRCWMEYMDI